MEARELILYPMWLLCVTATVACVVHLPNSDLASSGMVPVSELALVLSYGQCTAGLVTIPGAVEVSS